MLYSWNSVDTRLSHCLELYECGDHCCTRLENLVERYQWSIGKRHTPTTNTTKTKKKTKKKTRWHKVRKKKQKTNQTETATHQCIPRDFFYTHKRARTHTSHFSSRSADQEFLLYCEPHSIIIIMICWVPWKCVLKSNQITSNQTNVI